MEETFMDDDLKIKFAQQPLRGYYPRCKLKFRESSPLANIYEYEFIVTMNIYSYKPLHPSAQICACFLLWVSVLVGS
jgi:hypothetical protein